MSARSLVAGVNALFRMAESRLPEAQRVLDDPFAAALGEGHPVVWLIRGVRYLVPPLRRTVEELRTAHCVRHAALDTLLLRSLDEGFRQVLILGAGYDARAGRFPRQGVRWFEVDRAEMLDRKVGVGHSQRIAYDLSRPGLRAALVAAGWRPQDPTVVLLEGVVHYLSRADLQALLSELGEGPRVLLLSFIRPDMARRSSTTLNNLFRAMREIPGTFYDAAELAEIGEAFGFSGFCAWGFEEQVRELVPRAAGRLVGVSQDVARLERGGGGGGVGAGVVPGVVPGIDS